MCVFLLCLCLFDFSQSGIKLNQTESSPTLRFDIICLLAFWLPFFDGTCLFQPGYPHQIGATSPWTGTRRPAIGRAEQLQRPTKVERDVGDRHGDGYSHRHVLNVAIGGLFKGCRPCRRPRKKWQGSKAGSSTFLLCTSL